MNSCVNKINVKKAFKISQNSLPSRISSTNFNYNSMKKILLSIAAIAALTSTQAQIYTANDATALGAWTFVDIDGDTYNFSMQDLTSGGSPLASQGATLLSNSWVSAGGGTALTPNNIAVSPVINCSAALEVTLDFKAGSIETTASGWYEEHYAVYVVTNTAALIMGTFPTPVLETTLTAGEVMQPQSLDITAVAAGQATVYVVIRHFNCTDENFIVFDDFVVTGQFASVDENQIEMSVFPNPTTETLNFTMNAVAESISIYSVDGQLVSNELINATTASIDVTGLTEGVYFYEVTTTEGLKSRSTFVKK